MLRLQAPLPDRWNLPLTDAYGASTITLPLFAHMTDGQQDLVVEALAEAVVPAGRA